MDSSATTHPLERSYCTEEYDEYVVINEEVVEYVDEHGNKHRVVTDYNEYREGNDEPLQTSNGHQDRQVRFHEDVHDIGHSQGNYYGDDDEHDGIYYDDVRQQEGEPGDEAYPVHYHDNSKRHGGDDRQRYYDDDVYDDVKTHDDVYDDVQAHDGPMRVDEEVMYSNDVERVIHDDTLSYDEEDFEQGQQGDDGSQEQGYAGGDSEAPTYTTRGSTSSQRTSTSSFEDSLPTYQPPKRYEKKEEKSSYRGPSVFITDSNEMAATSANQVIPNGPESANQNGPTEVSSNQEKEEVIKPSQPFGTLLAVYNNDTEDVGAGNDNMCKACNKRVYEMEKMIADKAIYHKTCFKCSHCKRILSLGNFASMDGNPYCKPHFIELFKTKGKYDGIATQAGKPITLATQQQHEAPPGDGYQEAPGDEDPSHGYGGGMSPDGQMNGGDHEEYEPQRRDDVVREVHGEKDEVRFTQLNSVRSMFESASQTVDKPAPSPVSRPTPATRQSSTPSRWDKPREDAPPPVNRQNDDEEEPVAFPEEELPPAAMTRNLVAKFRDISGSAEVTQHRKPVHKITPPQEVLREGIEEARAIERAQRDPNIVRGEDSGPDDLPPPAITKNVAAKFRSMEDTNLPSPSPTKSVTKKSVQATSYSSERPRQSTNRASPDSGIVDVDARYAGGNESDERVTADQDETEVVREADGTDEKELPEQGITRNLLARWRDIEQKTDFKAPVMADHRAPSRTYSSTKSTRSAPPQQQEIAHEEPQAFNSPPEDDGRYEEHYDDQVHDREVMRETDNNEEENLPPAAFTRNMLEKFRNLEAEAEALKQTPSPSTSSRKQFKWAVKEAPPMNRAGMTWQETQSTVTSDVNDERFDEEGHYINSHHDDREEEHQFNNQQQEENYYDNDGQQIYENIDEHYDHDEDRTAESRHELEKEEEIPPPAFTKNLLAKFKSLEDVSKPPPTPQMANEAQRASRGSMALKSRQVHYVSDESRGVHMNGEREPEYQGQYEDEDSMYENIPADHHYDDVNHHGDDSQDRGYHEQHAEDQGGEYANEPVHNPNVIREGDGNETEELPEHGITRNLLAKFQSLQAH